MHRWPVPPGALSGVSAAQTLQMWEPPYATLAMRRMPGAPDVRRPGVAALALARQTVSAMPGLGRISMARLSTHHSIGRVITGLVLVALVLAACAPGRGPAVGGTPA